jgi:hypothetical protein
LDLISLRPAVSTSTVSVQEFVRVRDITFEVASGPYSRESISMIPRITVEVMMPRARLPVPFHALAMTEPTNIPVAPRDSSVPMVLGDMNDST